MEMTQLAHDMVNSVELGRTTDFVSAVGLFLVVEHESE